eukprot:gb/GECG01014004.1/.p1 GENE.gb/GECG01014004.1/~~gb/GECG01014004.1/.p1  ORF type:complete len:115 (+),score=9.80 gb/GECG01014004.1/:1-345(+)
MSRSVPIKLLHEGEGHLVTVELRTGEIYRGRLAHAEDNMNVSLKEATVTRRDGRVGKLDHVYLRGSHVRVVVLPDMLKNAPMFQKVSQLSEQAHEAMRQRGAGRGRGRNVFQTR